MATKKEYRVYNGGSPFTVIDENGRHVPSGIVGNTYFVDYRNGLDTNDGKTIGRAFKTLSAAYGACTSNNNDVIYIDGDSTVVETSMITWAKNRITVIGVGGAGHYGQAAKVSIGVTTAATDIALMQVSGVRNTFIGIKFISDNTVDEGLYTIAEGGEYSTYINCEFYKSTDLDETAASEFLHNGDSTEFYGCTFGSTANIIADDKIRPNVLFSATLTGKKCRDTYFENCIFWSKAGGTEHVACYGANATDIERMCLLKDCTFFNNPLSAATPAHAVGFGAAQTEGAVILKNCTSVDHTVMAQAAVGIYVDGAVPTFGTTGVSVAA